MNAFLAASGGVIDQSEPFLWAAVVVVTLAWLIFGVRRMHPVPHPWLRSSTW